MFYAFLFTPVFRLQDWFWRAVRHTDGPDGQIIAGLGPSREAGETCLTERWGRGCTAAHLSPVGHFLNFLGAPMNL